MKTIDISQQDFIVEIKTKIKEAQYNALKYVNKEQVTLYWNIGKSIMKNSKFMDGVEELWSYCLMNYKKNSLVFKVFQLVICGE